MDIEEIENVSLAKGSSALFIPTENEKKIVYELARSCAPIPYIAARVRKGIKVDTLKRAFHQELVLGYGETNAEVIKTLYQVAVEDKNVQALIAWVSKNPQLKWTEKQETLNSSEESISEIVLKIAE